MKNFPKFYSLLILGFFSLGIFSQAQAQKSVAAETPGINFFHGTFAQAQAKAKKEGKLIFLDAYTSWCGPCKMMSRSTFKDAGVGDVFNEKFVSLKVDMEKGEGPVLARKYRVRAYPTLLFINAEGKVVHKELGFKQAAQFKTIGESVGS